jgi:hypothetical protein
MSHLIDLALNLLVIALALFTYHWLLTNVGPPLAGNL